VEGQRWCAQKPRRKLTPWRSGGTARGSWGVAFPARGLTPKIAPDPPQDPVCTGQATVLHRHRAGASSADEGDLPSKECHPNFSPFPSIAGPKVAHSPQPPLSLSLFSLSFSLPAPPSSSLNAGRHPDVRRALLLRHGVQQRCLAAEGRGRNLGTIAMTSTSIRHSLRRSLPPFHRRYLRGTMPRHPHHAVSSIRSIR